MIVFERIDGAPADGDHTFAIYSCTATNGRELVALLAQTIRELYVDIDHLREVLTDAMNDMESVTDTTAVEEAIQRTLSAAVPVPGANPIPQLDTARSELAEALAHIALTQL